MTSTGRTVAVLGMMGRTPFAGVAWQVLQYLEGLRRVDCDVYYVEDTGDWPYDADHNTITDNPGYTVRYLGNLMGQFGFGDRWAYRSGVDGAIHGLSAAALTRVFERASAIINLTGATVLGDEHLRVPIRIYLETDPVLPQIEIAQGQQFTIDLLAAHTHHFTYGENIGTSACVLPTGQFRYMPTRQPIVADWWKPRDVRSDQPFTTIANWQQSGKDAVWNGETYTWSKHHEFLKLLDLPRVVSQPLELALACGDPRSIRLLRSHGWRVIDALPLSKGIGPYREYILNSRGEFTVAKDQNIRLRSGWFSDRSASYLMAGKPVITQDTGFDAILPVGQGLFAFREEEEVVAALAEILADYPRHSAAAHAIASEYFRAERVLGDLLHAAGL